RPAAADDDVRRADRDRRPRDQGLHRPRVHRGRGRARPRVAARRGHRGAAWRGRCARRPVPALRGPRALVTRAAGTAVRLDGAATAAELRSRLVGRVAALRAAGSTPGLGTLLVGDDPASVAYVAAKHRDCAEVGIASVRIDLPADASEPDVLEAVDVLNQDPAV